MKILHVVDQISQQAGGGGAKVAYELAQAQAKLGHKVTIYSSDFNATEQTAPDLVKLVKFKTWFTVAKVLHAPLGLLFASYDYDIVHLHNYRTIVNLLVALRNNKVVLQAHGNSSPLVSKIKVLQDIVWRNVISRKAIHYIADAEAEIPQYIVEGATRDKISIIPVGVNINEFKRLPKREAHDYKTIVYLGRLHRLKGADLLIDAVSLLNNLDVRLHIIGIDYGYKKELVKQVNELKLNNIVTFYENLDRNSIIRELVNADVFVMPSRYELWGIAFMEALACGTPVIMTDNCEASKLLPELCGTSVPFEVKRMAHAIRKYIFSGFAYHYREYRQRWALRYNWNNIAVRHIELYRWLLNE